MAKPQLIRADLQKNEANVPFQRMEGEPTLWWNRFWRYVQLGPKRSLQAALQQEQVQIKAIKSTRTTAAVAPAKGKQPKKAEPSVIHPNLNPLPIQKRPQVPGSWKQASVKWNWAERAKAFDEYTIDMLVESQLDELASGASLGSNRLAILKCMLLNLQTNYNANHNTMTYEQEFQCIARMQSILKDIRDEMAQYDDALERVLIHHDVTKRYENTPMEKFTEKK